MHQTNNEEASSATLEESTPTKGVRRTSGSRRSAEVPRETLGGKGTAVSRGIQIALYTISAKNNGTLALLLKFLGHYFALLEGLKVQQRHSPHLQLGCQLARKTTNP